MLQAGLGLDQYQHRRRTSWHRWTTLVILAHAFLAAATTHRDQPDPAGLVALTVNEFRHLFNVLVIEPGRRHTDPLLWSIRRRRHRARAMNSRYVRQTPDRAVITIPGWSTRTRPSVDAVSPSGYGRRKSQLQVSGQQVCGSGSAASGPPRFASRSIITLPLAEQLLQIARTQM